MDPLTFGALIAVGSMLLDRGGARVRYRERAAGVAPALQKLLDDWEAHGGFPILIAPDGGVRTDAAKQLAFFRQKNSQAPTLDLTPHGRGGALDVWPVSFDPAKPVTSAVYSAFHAIGFFAEQRQLRWGGRWTERSFKPTAQNPFGGDLPHIELADWRALPYPPRF